MDEYSGKRAPAKAGSSKRGSSLSLRNSNHCQSIQYCNRLGCSSRLNSIKGTQTNYTENLNLSRPSFRSTSSSNIGGSSSKQISDSNSLKKSHQDVRNQTSLQETDIVKSSSKQREDIESSIREEEINMESTSTSKGIMRVFPEPEDLESVILHGLSENATKASTRCSVESHPRQGKQLNRQNGSNYRDLSSSSFARHTVTSRNAIKTMKPASQGQRVNAKRYFRNLSCTSTSDVLLSGCSFSDSGCTKRTDSLRMRYSDGESSSARRKGTNGSLKGGNSCSPSGNFSGPSLSLSERPLSQPPSRRTKNSSRDGVASVRTQKASYGDTRTRLSNHRDDNTFSLPQPSLIPQLPQTQYPIPEDVPARPMQPFLTELPPVYPSSLERPGSSNVIVRRKLVATPEDDDTQMFRGSLVDSNGHRQFHMEGTAEALLALESIEQDEELSYEHLLVLDTYLCLGGLGFHDQHRDMRLDIDSMSYEELLDLEEKMGNVSTALSEEALSKCLERSIYMPASSISGNTGYGADHDKCSVCQEEYVAGDEVGKLGCDHDYHLGCINQWLRQKNWCPVCKASASPL